MFAQELEEDTFYLKSSMGHSEFKRRQAQVEKKTTRFLKSILLTMDLSKRAKPPAVETSRVVSLCGCDPGLGRC